MSDRRRQRARIATAAVGVGAAVGLGATAAAAVHRMRRREAQQHRPQPQPRRAAEGGAHAAAGPRIPASPRAPLPPVLQVDDAADASIQWAKRNREQWLMMACTPHVAEVVQTGTFDGDSGRLVQRVLDALATLTGDEPRSLQSQLQLQSQLPARSRPAPREGASTVHAWWTWVTQQLLRHYETLWPEDDASWARVAGALGVDVNKNTGSADDMDALKRWMTWGFADAVARGDTAAACRTVVRRLCCPARDVICRLECAMGDGGSGSGDAECAVNALGLEPDTTLGMIMWNACHSPRRAAAAAAAPMELRWRPAGHDGASIAAMLQPSVAATSDSVASDSVDPLRNMLFIQPNHPTHGSVFITEIPAPLIVAIMGHRLHERSFAQPHRYYQVWWSNDWFIHRHFFNPPATDERPLGDGDEAQPFRDFEPSLSDSLTQSPLWGWMRPGEWETFVRRYSGTPKM